MSFFNRLRDHPYLLEVTYQVTEQVVNALQPLWRRMGYDRAEALFRTPEKIGKGAVFNCKMCGQCTLHYTGMTCPMSCPKNLRNGPCGGVRLGGYCEVDATMKCVWVEVFERSQKMKIYGDDIYQIQPPLNQQNMDRSAFMKSAEIPKAWKTETGLSHEQK